jgi:subtilisin-like proprotein convertase family protein
LATSATFATNTIIASKIDLATGAWPVSVLLQKGKLYFWRVRPINECGVHAWSEIYAFATANESCATLQANDLPKNISTGASTTINSQIFVAGGAVSDVNVRKVGIFHDFFKDLKISLVHPDGSKALMMESKCGNASGNFVFGFDDVAPSAFLCPPGNLGTAYKPTELLSAFNGKDAQGNWKLEVVDNTPGGGGTLQAFEVEVCASVVANPPVIVTNNMMQIQGGSNALITQDLLKATDSDDAPEKVIFTLLSIPQYGHITWNGFGPMPVGNTFTMQDILDGTIRYYHYGSGQLDRFRFIVADPRGGLDGAEDFVIQPLNVATAEPIALQFNVLPNPAGAQITLRFAAPVSQQVQVDVLTTDGRQMMTSIISAGTEAKQMDVSALTSGLYFVRLTDGAHQQYAKFVKE